MNDHYDEEKGREGKRREINDKCIWKEKTKTKRKKQTNKNNTKNRIMISDEPYERSTDPLFTILNWLLLLTSSKEERSERASV